MISEKSLFDHYRLVYQSGKGSKKVVPLLIPLDTVNPIKKLVKETKEDIAELNAFLFPNKTFC